MVRLITVSHARRTAERASTAWLKKVGVLMPVASISKHKSKHVAIFWYVYTHPLYDIPIAKA